MPHSDENEVLEIADADAVQQRLHKSLREQQRLREAGDPHRLALDRRLREIRQKRAVSWAQEFEHTGEMISPPIEDTAGYSIAAE
jgi:DNA-binding IclR family transcriptional regulator